MKIVLGLTVKILRPNKCLDFNTYLYYNLNTMKQYNEPHIRKAEVAQLILLYHLYSQNNSHELIFQGGTALRWCYNGTRFSEDLDFVTTLPLARLKPLLAKAAKNAEREMVPHFGPGRLTVTEKPARDGACKQVITWQPATAREKIAIKLECEPLAANAKMTTARLVLSELPAVSYLILSGIFKIPRPSAVLVVETLQEILSDKIRALMERPYLKGRDLFDLWLLSEQHKTVIDPLLVERKLHCYSWPFKAARQPAFFLDPANRPEIINALEQDLSRFIPPATMELHRLAGYQTFLAAVQGLCRTLQELEIRFP